MLLCLPMAPALPIRKERRLRCVAVLWAELREAGLSAGYGQTQRSLQEGRRLMADSVEKVGSRSLKEIRLNANAIFDLICLPPQIDDGRLGLTRSRVVRPRGTQDRDDDEHQLRRCLSG